MNNYSPSVSVILPVYNREQFIAEAIHSVLAQRYKKLEIVVIDDGSTDSTAEVVKKFGDVVCYYYQERAGQTAARNLGIKNAHGEYIAFIDSDDLWPAHKLRNQMACFYSLPEAQIVEGLIQIETLNKPGKTEHQYYLEKYPHQQTNLGSMIVHRSVFDKIGIFNENLDFHEDTDFWLRARENDIKIVLQRQISLVYRLHGSNLTKDVSFKRLGLLPVLLGSIKRRRLLGKEGNLCRIKHLSEFNNFSARPLQRKESDRPLVSVIMLPIGQQYADKAIQSVLGQAYTPMEIILVSSDSVEHNMFQNNYGDSMIRCVLSPNQEIASMLNVGIAHAQGVLIALSDFGAKWHEDKLKTQIEFLTLNPEIDFVSSATRHILEPERKYPKNFLDGIAMRQRMGDILFTSLVRKHVFEQIGDFQSGMFGVEETDWLLRTRDANLKSVKLPRSLVHRYVEPEDEISSPTDFRGAVLQAARSSILRKREE